MTCPHSFSHWLNKFSFMKEVTQFIQSIYEHKDVVVNIFLRHSSFKIHVLGMTMCNLYHWTKHESLFISTDLISLMSPLTPRLFGSDKEWEETEKSELMEPPQACQSYAATVAIPTSGPVTATLTGTITPLNTHIHSHLNSFSWSPNCVLLRVLRGWGSQEGRGDSRARVRSRAGVPGRRNGISSREHSLTTPSQSTGVVLQVYGVVLSLCPQAFKLSVIYFF